MSIPLIRKHQRRFAPISGNHNAESLVTITEIRIVCVSFHCSLMAAFTVHKSKAVSTLLVDFEQIKGKQSIGLRKIGRVNIEVTDHRI